MRELRLRVAFRGGFLDVADVIRQTARQSFEAAFFRELPLRFFEAEAERFHRIGKCFRIEIAHAIVVRQTRLRAHAQAVANRHAVANARDA